MTLFAIVYRQKAPIYLRDMLSIFTTKRARKGDYKHYYLDKIVSIITRSHNQI
jgi:hypothetical protein